MISLSILYYIYFGFVLIFLLFTFFNVYHLLRFGFFSFGNFAITTSYIIGSILILSISWQYIGAIDWTQTYDVINILSLPTA